MQRELTFRQATAADITDIMRIRMAVLENRLSDPSKVTREMCEDYLGRLGRGWVCEVEGEVIGFSYAAKEDASIWALFILPEYEGIGVGKGLLQRAVDWLFSLGNEEIRLSTNANTRADRFYTAQGWTRGEMKDDEEVWFYLRRPIDQ